MPQPYPVKVKDNGSSYSTHTTHHGYSTIKNQNNNQNQQDLGDFNYADSKHNAEVLTPPPEQNYDGEFRRTLKTKRPQKPQVFHHGQQFKHNQQQQLQNQFQQFNHQNNNQAQNGLEQNQNNFQQNQAQQQQQVQNFNPSGAFEYHTEYSNNHETPQNNNNGFNQGEQQQFSQSRQHIVDHNSEASNHQQQYYGKPYEVHEPLPHPEQLAAQSQYQSFQVPVQFLQQYAQQQQQQHMGFQPHGFMPSQQQ